MKPFRILVVDDFDGFRRFLCLRLEEMTHCEVVGEASDGWEAVHKAEKLRLQDSSFEIYKLPGIGAQGYLLKSDAVGLPYAISAILEESMFVSIRLKCP